MGCRQVRPPAPEKSPRTQPIRGLKTPRETRSPLLVPGSILGVLRKRRMARRDYSKDLRISLAVSSALILLYSRTHRVQHPLFVGELAGLEFRVEQIAVERQLKTAAGGG